MSKDKIIKANEKNKIKCHYDIVATTKSGYFGT